MTASEEQCRRATGCITSFARRVTATQARGYRNADLRLMSSAVHEAFQKIVREGLLLDLGMDSFAGELSRQDAELVRQYVISRANIDRAARGCRNAMLDAPSRRFVAYTL